MRVLQRNQLVCLHDSVWQKLLAGVWDAQAQNLLMHWRTAQLPLVVCRQRAIESSTTVSLGLPAPLQWDRRKLALELALKNIARVATFPLLRDIALSPADCVQVQDFLLHTDALQARVEVYGSYGWQRLTGLPCVRVGSDLDLLAHVPDLDTAGQLVWLLQGLQLVCRVDGELVFPGGWAVAWREYAQLMGGKVEQVLVKHRTGVQLLGMSELRSCFGSASLLPTPAQAAFASVG